ncbi:MAG: hypothetical protein ACI9R3_004966 [Verrucomicrobiales bacterium]|jgi:hypothetical protein
MHLLEASCQMKLAMDFTFTPPESVNPLPSEIEDLHYLFFSNCTIASPMASPTFM